MQTDDKLKQAMAQIKAVLKEHDIAGFVILHEPGKCKFMNHLSASHSAAQMDDQMMSIIVDGPNMSEEQAVELTKSTVNMIHCFAKILRKYAARYTVVETALAKIGTRAKVKIPNLYNSRQERDN